MSEIVVTTELRRTWGRGGARVVVAPIAALFSPPVRGAVSLTATPTALRCRSVLGGTAGLTGAAARGGAAGLAGAAVLTGAIARGGAVGRAESAGPGGAAALGGAAGLAGATGRAGAAALAGAAGLAGAEDCGGPPNPWDLCPPGAVG